MASRKKTTSSRQGRKNTRAKAPVRAAVPKLGGTANDIVGLLLVAILPFFITATAVWFSNFTLLLSAVFFRAFLCCYVAAGLLAVFSTAGWLFCLFCLFCDCLQLPLLWLCWLQSISGERVSFLRRWIPCVLSAGVVSVFDFYIVSPFLAGLISF
jgi:hypothetical protein